jgi:hypothetical protein
MTDWLLAVSRDTQLGNALACAVVRKGRSYPFWAVATVDHARRLLGERGSLPVLIVIDELFLREEQLASVAAEFACYAPLIVIGRSVHQAQLAAGVAEGKIDFVLRDDRCVPLIAALVERALRRKQDSNEEARLAERRRLDRREKESEPDEDGFPEQSLRQLGAILDTLEIVLAQRKLLPTAVVRRLGRAADLAFDLKDGLRLLAGYPLRETDPDPDPELHASI